MHSSSGIYLQKLPQKKRQFRYVTCLKCQPTFYTRPKLKKYLKDQHEEKDNEDDLSLSPERKATKTEDKDDLDKRIEDEEQK